MTTRTKRPKLSAVLKALGWQFDGFLQCARVFKRGAHRIVVQVDEYHWTVTTHPDYSGQVAGQGKAALLAQLKAEGL